MLLISVCVLFSQCVRVVRFVFAGCSSCVFVLFDVSVRVLIDYCARGVRLVFACCSISVDVVFE